MLEIMMCLVLGLQIVVLSVALILLVKTLRRSSPKSEVPDFDIQLEKLINLAMADEEFNKK